MWARDNGYLADVQSAIEAVGKRFEHEVQSLYVSPVIAEALLTAVGCVPVLAPFKDVAVHVVQTPRAGQFLTDTVSVLLANTPRILEVPGVLSQLRHIIPKAVNRGCSATAGVLPLGFGR